jgi:hypothetical protein
LHDSKKWAPSCGNWGATPTITASSSLSSISTNTKKDVAPHFFVSISKACGYLQIVVDYLQIVHNDVLYH